MQKLFRIYILVPVNKVSLEITTLILYMLPMAALPLLEWSELVVTKVRPPQSLKYLLSFSLQIKANLWCKIILVLE